MVDSMITSLSYDYDFLDYLPEKEQDCWTYAFIETPWETQTLLDFTLFSIFNKGLLDGDFPPATAMVEVKAIFVHPRKKGHYIIEVMPESKDEDELFTKSVGLVIKIDINVCRQLIALHQEIMKKRQLIKKEKEKEDINLNELLDMYEMRLSNAVHCFLTDIVYKGLSPIRSADLNQIKKSKPPEQRSLMLQGIIIMGEQPKEKEQKKDEEIFSSYTETMTKPVFK